MTPHDSKNLEALIARAVKELPHRTAPRSLESRVLAEIQRRALLPWYHQSFSRWPASARAGFLVVSAAAAAVLTVAVLPFLFGAAPAALQPYTSNAQSWYDSLRNAGQVFTRLGDHTLSSINTLWLYAGLAVLGGCYAALVGVGAVAYRAVRSQETT